MKLFSQSIAHAAVLLFLTVQAQQFAPDRLFPYDTYGFSASCVEALNTTAACSIALAQFAPKLGEDVVAEVMDTGAVSAVCVDKCRASLVQIRSKVQAACGLNDKFREDGIVYPATYPADLFLFQYDSSCYKHRTSGKICDLVLQEWRDQSSETDTEDTSHNCDDCMLGPIKVGLEQAVSYDDETDEDFKSMTSSCKATGYEFKTPYLSYLQTDSSTPTTTTSSGPTQPTASCETPYTIATGDTCDSISLAKNVSTFGLIDQNHLAISCKLPPAGETICLPESCQIGWLGANVGCRDLQQQYNITRVQLTTWNPNFDSSCFNIQNWIQTYVCVGAPGTIGDDNTLPVITTTESGVPAPTDAAPHSKRCAFWHTVQKGEYCGKLAHDNSLSLQDFFFLNPDLKTDCSNIEQGVSYCVKPVGDITSYPGHPSQEPTTSFTRPPPYTATLPTPTTLPHAPGSDSGCPMYENYFDVDEFNKLFPDNDSTWLQDYNQCTFVAGKYGISLADFVKWNPSLAQKDCVMQPGQSYCVRPGPMDEDEDL